MKKRKLQQDEHDKLRQEAEDILKKQKILDDLNQYLHNTTTSKTKDTDPDNKQQNKEAKYSNTVTSKIPENVYAQTHQHISGQKQRFAGIITLKSDLISPKQFSWSEGFCVVNFTDYNTYQGLNDVPKRKIVGKLPLLLKNTVYNMLLQEECHAVHGWAWKLLGVEIHPPYSNINNLMLHFAAMVAIEPRKKYKEDQEDKKLNTHKKNIISKSFKQQMTSMELMARNKPLSKENLSLLWNEWLLSTMRLLGTDCVQDLSTNFDIGENNARNSLDVENMWKIYPLIGLVYKSLLFGDEASKRNSWWDSISDELKQLWEDQLKTPLSAFRMCFRETMPAKLQFLANPVLFEQMDDDDCDGSECNNNSNQQNQQLKSDIIFRWSQYIDLNDSSVSNKENQDIKKKNKSFRQQLKVQLVKAQHMMVLEKLQIDIGNKPNQIVEFIPELSLKGFQLLCYNQGWVDYELSIEDERQGKTIRKISKTKLVQLKYEPNLKKFISAIGAYKLFCNLINRRNDCCVDAKAQIPQEFHEGIDMLLTEKVLCEIPNCSTSQIIHNWWFHCKKLLASILKSNNDTILKSENNNNDHIKPENTYDVDANNDNDHIKPENTYHANANNNDTTINSTDNNNQLNQDQRNVINMVRNNPVSIVIGEAGTGKTECIKMIDKAFPGDCTVVSFTGRAVEEIESRLQYGSSYTIHSLINILGGAGSQTIKILIIDEASMITEILIMKLVAQVKFNKIVFVGDPNQIPSFGLCKGAILEELMHVFPTIELLINYRQEKDPNNLILKNAAYVLNPNDEGGRHFQFDQHSFRIRPAEKGLEELIQQFVSSKFQDITFITAKTAHSIAINVKCVQSLNPHLRNVSENIVKNFFSVGDRVLFEQRIDRSTDDELDSFLNNQYYQSMSYYEADFQQRRRQLFKNGQQAIILDMFVVRDSVKLCQYYNHALLDFMKTNHLKHDEAKKQFDVEKHATNPPPGCIDELKEWSKCATRYDYKSPQRINDHFLIIKLSNGKCCRLSDRFQHGYATTIYKLQGSSKNNIGLYLPNYKSDPWLSQEFGRKHLYCSVTRAIKCFTYLGTGGLADLKQMTQLIHPNACFLRYFF